MEGREVFDAFAVPFCFKVALKKKEYQLNNYKQA